MPAIKCCNLSADDLRQQKKSKKSFADNALDAFGELHYRPSVQFSVPKDFRILFMLSNLRPKQPPGLFAVVVLGLFCWPNAIRGQAPSTGLTGNASGIRATLPENASLPRFQGVVQAAHSELTPVPPSGEEAFTLEKITAELAAIEALTDIDADLKKEHVERLNKAAKWLQDEQDSARRKAELDAQIALIPELLKKANEELSKPSPPVQVEFPNGATVAQLETKLAELRHQVEVDDAALRVKEEEAENRGKRLSEISKESVDIEKRITDAKQQLTGLVGSDLTTKTKQIEQKAQASEGVSSN